MPDLSEDRVGLHTTQLTDTMLQLKNLTSAIVIVGFHLEAEVTTVHNVTNKYR